MLDFPLLICCWVHYLAASKIRWFTIATLPLLSLETFLKTDRGTMIIYAVTCIVIWLYWNRWTTINWMVLRRLMVMGFLLLGYFLAIGLMYGKLVSMQTDVFKAADLSVSSEMGLVLVTPYIYATSPLGGFQAAIEDVDRLSWGTHTFFPLARLLYAVDLINERPEAYSFDFYQVPVPVNTYTQLFSFYQDFGALGVVLLPGFLGFLQTRFYLRMKVEQTLFLLAGTSLFAALNFFGIFGAPLSSVTYWFCLIVVYAVSRGCTSRIDGTLGSALPS